MRIKNFTLLTLALFVMSVVAFAQKPISTQRVFTPKQQLQHAIRTGQLTKEKASAFKFAKPALPQNMQKAKANKPVFPVALQAPQRSDMQAYTYGFSQAMNGWTAIDADGDGDGWELLVNNSSIPGHDGNLGMMTSASYRNAPLNPDNYLVSPKMKLNGKLSFFACAQDASYPSEHFAVMVSTASGTNPSDFSMVQEWTMTAAPTLAPAANFDAPAGAFRSPRRVQGNWYLYEVDLSGYGGAEGYVAIRHYQCTDWFRLNVDDITLETTEMIDAYDPDLETTIDTGTSEVVTPPAGLLTEDWTIARYFCNSNGDTPDERVLQVGFDGSDVYVQGFSYYQADAWIKGTLSEDGKSITFESGQYYGAYGDEYDMWFAGWDYLNDALVPVTVTYDAEAGTMTWPDDIVLLENGAETEAYYYGYFDGLTMLKGVAPDPLPAPDIVNTEWYFKSQRLTQDQDTGDDMLTEYNLHVHVGIAGNDVFVKGLSEDSPEAWVKGTLDPATNKVVFASGQCVGGYYTIDMSTWSYVYVKQYLTGYGDGMENIVMDYDAEAKTLTMESPTYMIINESWLVLNPSVIMTDVQMQEIFDVAATPAQPTITAAKLTGSYPYVTVDIPDTDVEGNPLLGDKLSYQYFIDVDHTVSPLTLFASDYSKLSADMTEIPYNFTDDYDIYNYGLYLNQDFSSWNKLGIQSIYRGGGEERKSEISWFTFVPYSHQVSFVAANDLNIQNNKATVKVNGKKAEVDAEGKLAVPETYTVTIAPAKGYRFVSASSTDATVTLADDLFSATFEMPTTDVTINYELREMDGDIIFATEGEFTIQNGLASVLVNDADVTKDIDDTGKLIDIAQGATVTINAAQGYKLTSVEASYTPKSTGGGGAASEIEIGSGDDLNSYVPTYSLYNYALTQQIYTAAEIGQAGQINSISFFNGGTEKGRNIDIYLVHTTKSTFDGANDWIAATANDKVFSGGVTFTADGEWTTITLDTPFSYNGTDNLAVIVDDNSGEWSSGLKCNVFDATDQAIRVYNDYDDYDPANPASYTGTVMSVKNQIKLGMAGGTAPAAVGVDVALAKKGNTASFIMPGPGGKVNVTYEIERLGYPIEVPADAYITYYTDKDILIYDTDCELMTVTGLNGNEVAVTPLNVVAANTPILIHNSAGEKELWIVPAEETADAPAADEVTVLPAFKGTLTGQTFSDADMAAKDYYAFNGYSFAWVRSAGSIAANKCWLEFEKDAAPKVSNLVIGFGSGETTGINTVNGKMDTDGQYYDLNGRKLNAAPTQKGVYIVNGKKAVVK